MITFGQKVRLKRTELRMSSSECAKRAGVAQPAWSRWENDTGHRKDGSPSQPERTTVEKVAAGLNMPVEYWLKEAGYDSSDYAELDMRLAKRLEPYLKQIPAEKRGIAEETLEQVARGFASSAS